MDKSFYTELLIIKSMTNKINSERIQRGWNDIIGKANFSKEDE